MNEKQTGNIVTNGINSRSLWAEAWLRFKRNRVAVAGLIFVAFLIVVSIATLVLDLVTSNEIYNAYVVKQNLSLKLAPRVLNTYSAVMNMAATYFSGLSGVRDILCSLVLYP